VSTQASYPVPVPSPLDPQSIVGDACQLLATDKVVPTPTLVDPLPQVLPEHVQPSISVQPVAPVMVRLLSPFMVSELPVAYALVP
jgi:hypothetical protein